jgi:hypothetical protein
MNGYSAEYEAGILSMQAGRQAAPCISLSRCNAATCGGRGKRGRRKRRLDITTDMKGDCNEKH